MKFSILVLPLLAGYAAAAIGDLCAGGGVSKSFCLTYQPWLSYFLSPWCLCFHSKIKILTHIFIYFSFTLMENTYVRFWVGFRAEITLAAKHSVSHSPPIIITMQKAFRYPNAWKIWHRVVSPKRANTAIAAGRMVSNSTDYWEHRGL